MRLWHENLIGLWNVYYYYTLNPKKICSKYSLVVCTQSHRVFVFIGPPCLLLFYNCQWTLLYKMKWPNIQYIKNSYRRNVELIPRNYFNDFSVHPLDHWIKTGKNYILFNLVQLKKLYKELRNDFHNVILSVWNFTFGIRHTGMWQPFIPHGADLTVLNFFSCFVSAKWIWRYSLCVSEVFLI